MLANPAAGATRLGRLAFLAILLLFMAMGAPASANEVPYQVQFYAQGFGPGAPADPFSGSFTVTFDPTIAYLDKPIVTALTFDSNPFTAPVTAVTDWPTCPDAPGLVGLFVGGALWGASGIATGTDDFFLWFSNFTSSSPSLNYVIYTTADTAVDFFSPNCTVAVTAVPLPPTVLLLGSGLLGLVGWRKFRKS